MSSGEEEAWLRASVVRRSELSPGVVLLAFRVESPAFAWKPGQYVQIALPDPSDLVQPYSIASAPDAERPGEFELAVSRAGSGLPFAELPLGAPVLASPPQGSFVWERGAHSELFVGMGTGIAPLRAMIQAGNRATQITRVLLYGARTEADVLFRTELERLAAQSPAFHFEPTLSRPGPLWKGRRGRVHDHLPAIVKSLVAPRVYVCGTLPMVKDSVKSLVSLGIPRESIASEAHGE
ncbi:MAG TPA: FAD-dependent oxidoreductase [Polyangiaceae bacterium]|nr:FAD-dependent oxidoreductase [Polyangiaceae bacterium]